MVHVVAPREVDPNLQIKMSHQKIIQLSTILYASKDVIFDKYMCPLTYMFIFGDVGVKRFIRNSQMQTNAIK